MLNLGVKEAMHFGRCHPILEKPYPLPQDGPRTQKFLRLPFSGRRKVFVGAPILGHEEWKGMIYPENIRSSRVLEHYSQVFNSLELNSSFYAQPSGSQIKKWKQAIDPNFRFVAKVPRKVSENISSSQAVNDFADFAGVIAEFGENLGLAFMQLSETYSKDKAGQLYSFLNKIKGQLPLAVELRHPQWFHDHCLADDLVNHLYVNGFVPVITDTIGKRYALHTSLTGQKIMIRFLAYDHDSDRERFADWVMRIEDWLSHGMDEVYFFIHHEDHKKIPRMVQEFTRMIFRKLGHEMDHRLILDLDVTPVHQPTLFTV